MKVDVEKVFLAVFMVTFLFVGVGILFDHRIEHPFPWAYLASDTFQHQVRMESIKLMGDYRFEAPYIVTGYTDNVGFYPPVLYHVGILFSNAAGLETYDGGYLLVFVLSSLAALLMYLIIKKWSKYVAILSLPMSILVFHAAPYIGFTWGHWPSIAGQVFLLAFFWSLLHSDMKFSYLFIALSLAGILMTHTSEGVFAFIFLLVFVSVKIVRGMLTKDLVKRILIGGFIGVVISFYYLVIFKFTWMRMQPYSFYIERDWAGSPLLSLQDFGLAIALIIAGLLLVVALFRKIKEVTPLLVGTTMLLIGYLNYAGFGPRAFQARFFWPIYLSVFAGFGIYYILRLFGRRWNNISAIIVSLLLLSSLGFGSSSALIPRPAKFSSPGLMNEFHWEMFQWFQNNGQKNVRVLFFYGDIFGQNAILRNAHIPPSMVKFDEFGAALQNRTIRRYYTIRHLGDHHGVHYAYRKSFFDFGYRAEEMGRDYYYDTMRDVCEFEYYVIDKASREQALAQYNIMIANELLKNDYIQVVFDNQLTSVLQNSQPGEDCLPEEGVGI